MTQSALAVWDFTLSVKRSTDNHSDIIKELEQFAKKWTFQLEDSSREPATYETGSDSGSENDYSSGISSDDEDVYSDYSSGISSDNEDDVSDTDVSDTDVSDTEVGDDTYSDSDSDSDSENSGYLHWQGKISLMKRRRKCELISLLKTNGLMMQKAHFSPSSNNALGNIFYVMKLDTRVKGPWSDTDEKEIPIPSQLKSIQSLYPWQQEVVDRSLYCWNPRTINVIYDPTGNNGKTVLTLWCKVHRILDCKLVPCILQSFMDLNQAVMSQPVGGMYFVDMPRSLPKHKLSEFMAFVETLKNGYVFDTRYRFSERIFNSPVVWLFTNVLIDKKLLSGDRWVYWTIDDDKQLVYYPSMKRGPPIVYPMSEDDIDDLKCALNLWRALAKRELPLQNAFDAWRFNVLGNVPCPHEDEDDDDDDDLSDLSDLSEKEESESVS